MDKVVVNPAKFDFKYLPAYADYILKEKLEEYVRHSIKFSKEEDLPLLRPLSRFSDEELVALSIESSREVLEALTNRRIHIHILENVRKWISNKLEIIDKDDIVAEDLSLVSFIRRKALSCFLPEYTEDRELKRELLSEIDVYTTQEELVAYNAYIRMQQDKLNKINTNLEFHESLLLEAQEISGLGSYYIDYTNPENSVVTPQMHNITGLPVFSAADAFFEHVHPEDVAMIRATWETAYSEGGNFDYTFRYLINNTEKRLHSRGLVKVVDGRPVNVRGTLKDITKEYELIERLTESEELHKQAQQLTHLGNWSWEVGTEKIVWSDEMYRIYGLQPNGAEITFGKFISLIHPDDRERRQKEIQESIDTGIVNDYTLKIVNPDGKIKILKGHGSMVFDEHQNPLKIVGTCQDITKEFYLNRELVQLNNSLSKKNHELVNINHELESFNYIASHDLQEPLRKIQIYSGRLLEQAENISDDAKQSVNKVIYSASRMQRLIADLIEFSQISAKSEAFEMVSLGQMIEEVRHNFSHLIEAQNAIFKIGPLPRVKVIHFQFVQLLTNIIGNALKYKRDGVGPELTISSKMVTEENIEAFPPSSGNYFVLRICDNGIGFDEGQKEKIFELFKRLHSSDKYSGTGIGLAICKKIVNNHNGFIRAESEKGKGSCFEIYLPENLLAE